MTDTLAIETIELQLNNSALPFDGRLSIALQDIGVEGITLALGQPLGRDEEFSNVDVGRAVRYLSEASDFLYEVRVRSIASDYATLSITELRDTASIRAITKRPDWEEGG